MTTVDKLIDASRAVINRWDSPFWKDLPSTATYIEKLRQALAEYEQNHIVDVNNMVSDENKTAINNADIAEDRVKALEELELIKSGHYGESTKEACANYVLKYYSETIIQALQQPEQIILSQDEYDAFIKKLDEPAKDIPALRELLKPEPEIEHLLGMIEELSRDKVTRGELKKKFQYHVECLTNMVRKQRNKTIKANKQIEDMKRRIAKFEKEKTALILRASSKKEKMKMCGNKKSFRTKKLAEKTADKFDDDYRVYECPICYCFHVTTTNASKKEE